MVSALSMVSGAIVAWGRINGIPIPTRVMVNFPLKSLTSFDKKGVIRHTNLRGEALDAAVTKLLEE